MAKSSGLGDNFYLGGYNLSGDVQALGRIATPRAVQDSTGIDKLAMERLMLLGDGAMEWTSFFNKASAQAHPVLSALPTADVVGTYCRGTTLGNPSACLVGKQINYDPTRGADGSLTVGVQVLASSGVAAEWGNQLTAGQKTDTAGANGTGVDFGASTSFGWSAYLQVFEFSGTDFTVTLEDSANNSTFATFTGSAFTQVTAARRTERIASASPTATVRRYVRAVTSGTFTSVTFAVAFMKNTAAQS